MFLVLLTAAAGGEAEHRKLITGSGSVCGAAVDRGPGLPRQHPHSPHQQAQPQRCKLLSVDHAAVRLLRETSAAPSALFV